MLLEEVILTQTLRAQTSAKTAQYPHVARIHDLESQPGDPDHPTLQSYPENFM